ncbi:hypothetical protein M0812_17911 [Anaeramoeba flamelloides]|uniref:Stealth protein CR2 conserved region 2 domain-containing protein n=1 Tax=Anaeramoeba flamelloides TaxID=1746091 RepID=A0AAV7Z183_9EUKA|nr:hypothetical protein M0812_17911 [Anaeramoeba flamelloides]
MRIKKKKILPVFVFIYLFVLLLFVNKSEIKEKKTRFLYKELENEKTILKYERKKFEIEKEEYKFKLEKDKDQEKVDVVYTWGGVIKDMDIRNRYNFELQYSLRSVNKYLPWINKIYILINSDTDYPYWLKSQEKQSKVILVNRCKLFDDPNNCPTYNSFAVFSVIHKVANLTNKFILIDDDVFFNQPLNRDYFFSKHGRIKFYHGNIRMKIYEEDDFVGYNIPVYKYQDYSHLPKPMRRDFIQAFHKMYPGYAWLVQSHKMRFKELSEEMSMIYYDFFDQNGNISKSDYSEAKLFQIPHEHPNDIQEEFIFYYKELTTRNIKVFNCNDDFSTNTEIYNKQRYVLFTFYNKLYPEVPHFEVEHPNHEKIR